MQVVEEVTVADRQVAVLAVASDDLVEQIDAVDSLVDLLGKAVAVADSLADLLGKAVAVADTFADLDFAGN
ncbi:MAG: hypothetical protein Phog2KO_34880 [Phototrophicaceae bacterium]